MYQIWNYSIKKNAPKTFKAQAVKYYLSQKIVIIAICGKEIKQLIDQKGNLLELIERKATEIMVDSTSDLVQAGLYDIKKHFFGGAFFVPIF